MTLVFIGHIDPSKQACIENAATQIEAASFSLTLDKIDHFGQRILWLGCSRIPEALLALHESLNESLVTHCDFQPEARRYRPHITLQRKLRKPQTAILEHPILWPITRFSLIESIPATKQHEQPCYKPLKHWRLDRSA